MKDEYENRLKIVVEALRHTEMRISCLNVLAAGAESRALHFATLTTAFGTVLVINAKDMPGPVLTYVVALLLFILACCSVGLALPRRFHVTGHFWADWEEHVTDNDDYLEVLISQAKENDDRINFNEKLLERSAKYFKIFFVALVYVLCFFISSQLGEFWEL